MNCAAELLPLRARIAMLACALALPGAGRVFAADATDPPRGPRVEIAPRDGGAPYICTLLKMAAGRVELRMPGGERIDKDIAALRSIRFLPLASTQPEPRRAPAPAFDPPVETPPPTVDSGAKEQKPPTSEPPETHETHETPEPHQIAPADKMEERASPAELLRLRHLIQKNREGRLTPAEEEELKKMREHMPVLPRFGKFKTAEELARLESGKGRIENYINDLHSRLKNTPSDEDAKDALLALVFAYRQKDMPPPKIAEALKADAEAIGNEKVREQVKEKLPEMIDLVKTLRLGGRAKPQ